VPLSQFVLYSGQSELRHGRAHRIIGRLKLKTAGNARRSRVANLTPAQVNEMRSHLAVSICVAVMSFTTLSSPSYAQQKTVKACEDEWRAKRAENQKAGITEKAYVEKCRAETAVAPPATPAAPAPAATKAPQAKEPAPAAAKAPQAPTPAASAAPTGANQFAAEAAAKAHCPTDTIVWLNTSSKIFHFASSKDYGKTKSGAYMCEKDSLAAGNRAAKNEKQR
jgi:hypothetical protein